MRFALICNKIIEFSFYAIFFLVPLIFWKDTSELFELPKMWLTFILVILIAASWGVKIIVTKKFYFQKTPLDLPIGLFLASQIVSTIFSLDPYVSFWGYYSRFNGGLLSIICYIFLYYAFLSNFDLKTESVNITKKFLIISLVSGAIVALWGLPSHFGYDPTCLIFRGSLDVSCWIGDFQPKIRIFSTLGQPDWLGAYLAILSPLAIAMAISNLKSQISNRKTLFAIGYMLLAVIFYVDILFTKSRAALLGFWGSLIAFAIHYFLYEQNIKIQSISFKKVWPKVRPLSLLLIVFFVLTAAVFTPIEFNKGKVQKAKVQTPIGSFSNGGGGTESGKIRLYVWQGAINAWIHNPIIGTGVETFAFAYYKYKPVGHNLTSEWNYLYNKAHNEYLNFLATTGLFGLFSYLLIIIIFMRESLKRISNFKFQISNLRLAIALLAGYVSILVSNFFGFSVVIVNVYFFLIPAFVFVLTGMLNPKKNFIFSFEKSRSSDIKISLIQKLDILAIVFFSGYLLLFLRNFWLADQAYGLGSNLARAGEYTSSYTALKEAVYRAGFEPTYKDELAENDAIFAVGLLSNLPKDDKKQKSTLTFAQDLAKEAIVSIDQITKEHPNNVTFLKTKVRVYYILSQIDPKYNKDALDAIKRAQQLSPTDANIYYNLGLLYGQENDTKKAIESLKLATKVKPNYENAYYALGLFYRQLATDKNGKVVDFDLNKKAIEQMEYILKNLNPKNTDAKDALDAFQKI